MPYSHHSHSGQFCNHAKDQLEEVVLEAIRQGMEILALTEHMPRNEEADLYPGEVDTGWSLAEQQIIYDGFYHKARELQKQYKDKIELLVGLEIDWIRPESKEWIESLLMKYPLDLFVGSVHHVHGIPIDFDQDHYTKAMQVSSERAERQSIDIEELLFEDYFDDQLAMLKALKPPLIGHFDLIRLLSSKKDVSWDSYPTVWHKVKRNLDFIKSYDGILELNSAGLRKGLKEPYPQLEICEYFHTIGGRFVLSDDSHGVDQVGHSYEGLLAQARRIGIKDLAVFTRRDFYGHLDDRFPAVGIKMRSLDHIKQHEFWERRAS